MGSDYRAQNLVVKGKTMFREAYTRGGAGHRLLHIWTVRCFDRTDIGGPKFHRPAGHGNAFERLISLEP